MQYPKTKYKVNTPGVQQIIENEEQDNALGKEWADSPAAAGWLGEESRDNAAKASARKAKGKVEVDEDFVDELKKQIDDLVKANKALEAQLEEAENYIDTLEAQIDKSKEAELTGDAPDATDKAIDLATEHGIDLRVVKGTGAKSKIKKGDVQDYIDSLEDEESKDDAEGDEAEEEDETDPEE